MSKTLTVSFSDTEIERHLSNDNVRQLKDPRFPLRLRFNVKREKASWFVIKYANNKTIWRKLGNWPDLKTKEVLKILPSVNRKLSCNLEDKALYSQFNTIEDLLIWYKERTLSDKSLSVYRKRVIKSAINVHLIKILGKYKINALNKRTLDSEFFWSLQSKYSLSHVRSLWMILKSSFKRAKTLDLIDVNPLSEHLFTDSISAKIEPKEANIRSDEVAALLSNFRKHKITDLTLIFMMLLHGSRIGETRKAQWSHISFTERNWFVPLKNTKTKAEHNLPLTKQAISLLQIHKRRLLEKGYDGVYLFPAKNKRKHLNEKQANTLVSKISQGQWTSRDFRKLTRTVLKNLDVDYMVSELLLNHEMTKLDKTYMQNLIKKPERDALEQYHAWLDTQGLLFFTDFEGETIARRLKTSNCEKA